MSPSPSTSQSSSQSAITLPLAGEGTYQSKTSGVKLFDVICPETEILTEDVMANSSFVSCVQSAQSVILYYLHLKHQYTSKIIRRRKSALQSRLSLVDAKVSSIVSLVNQEVATVKITPSLGLDRLALSCSQKQKLLKNLGQSLLSLKSDLNASGILNDLRRRIKQQDDDSKEYRLECYNNPDFTLLTEPWI